MTPITLPFPVSVHEVFRKHNGRHLSESYRQWRDIAGWQLVGQKPQRHVGPVSILIELRAPDKRRRDADNYIKAPLDLLVSHGIIEADDNQTVRQVSAAWVESGEPCSITIKRAGE